MAMTVTTTSEDNPLWRISDVRRHFGVSAMWIWRKTREADFPKAIKFGGPRSARFWRRDAILEWEQRYALARAA